MVGSGRSDYPSESKLRVRYRIDGTLHDMFSLPSVTATPLISRIKILANMNIADHHRPQDGQFSVKTKGRLIDIRVGIIGTVYGEMAVLRLLDKSRATLTLAELGFSPEYLEKYGHRGPQEAEFVLVEPFVGLAYCSDDAFLDIGATVDEIYDPVIERIVEHAVHGEVASVCVVFG